MAPSPRMGPKPVILSPFFFLQAHRFSHPIELQWVLHRRYSPTAGFHIAPRETPHMAVVSHIPYMTLDNGGLHHITHTLYFLWNAGGAAFPPPGGPRRRVGVHSSRRPRLHGWKGPTRDGAAAEGAVESHAVSCRDCALVAACGCANITKAKAARTAPNSCRVSPARVQ